MRNPLRDFRAQALKVLGLADPFTEEDLKRAYRGAARKHHPDYANGSDEAMQRVNEARDYLREHPTPEPIHISYYGDAFSEFSEFMRQQAAREKAEREARDRTPGGRVDWRQRVHDNLNKPPDKPPARKWKPKVHNRVDPEVKAREERAVKHADFLRSIGLK